MAFSCHSYRVCHCRNILESISTINSSIIVINNNTKFKFKFTFIDIDIIVNIINTIININININFLEFVTSSITIIRNSQPTVESC